VWSPHRLDRLPAAYPQRGVELATAASGRPRHPDDRASNGFTSRQFHEPLGGGLLDRSGEPSHEPIVTSRARSIMAAI
jgi:hypothetical protein